MLDAHTERLMMGAAGASGDKIYMEDLFDTQVWKGMSDGQLVPRRMSTGQALGRSGSGKSLLLNASTYKGALPPATNTDTTACFTKYPGFSGASAGKTFTISFWWWPPQTQTAKKIICFGQDDINRTRFDLTIGHYFAVNAWDSGGSRFLDVNTSSYQPVARGQWNHIIISFDLSDTSKRKAYINDTQVSNWTWGTYSNANIGWDSESIGLFCERGSGGNIFGTKCTGYVSNFYMDLTYTELGTESNRRIFRTADGEPTAASTLTARSPLLFMPLDDATTLETNLGTGGNMSKHDSGSQNYPVVDFGPYLGDAIDAKGGMVWSKNRGATQNHNLFDTVRGVNKNIKSNTDDLEVTTANSLTAFNTDGYSISTDGDVNVNNNTFVDWSFTKQEKFFDIVNWTGDGVAGRTVSHNLGSVPGMVIIKCLNENKFWAVGHRSLDYTAGDYLQLNTDVALAQHIVMWNDTAPTSTNITLGTSSTLNKDGNTYVAYLFAHNDGDGIFGESGKEDVIKCGSYTGNGSTTGPVIDLGWEPQFILIKRTDSAVNWAMFDCMRGITTYWNTGYDPVLEPNVTAEEYKTSQYLDLTPRGFQLKITANQANANGGNYIYMAIRRSDGYVSKPAEAGTDVFAMDMGNNASEIPCFDSPFAPDTVLSREPAGTDNWQIAARITGNCRNFANDDWDTTANNNIVWDSNIGVDINQDANHQAWMWKRGASFDVVTYTGNGTAGRVVPHSLGKIPEMIWIKKRNAAENWHCYHSAIGNTGGVFLDLNYGASYSIQFWNDTSPDSVNFTVGINNGVNTNSDPYIAYLFASVDGISKCGSFTGNSSDQNIDLGFQPRLFIVKKYSASGHWYVFDTLRGISSGNDPRIQLDQNEAQNTSFDCLDLTSTGVTLHNPGSWFNESGDSYIYYAHA